MVTLSLLDSHPVALGVLITTLVTCLSRYEAAAAASPLSAVGSVTEVARPAEKYSPTPIFVLHSVDAAASVQFTARSADVRLVLRVGSMSVIMEGSSVEIGEQAA